MTSSPSPLSLRAFRHTEQTLASGGPWGPVNPRTFFLRIPFNLGLPDGSGLSMRRSDDLDEPPWVEIVVHRADISLRWVSRLPTTVA